MLLCCIYKLNLNFCFHHRSMDIVWTLRRTLMGHICFSSEKFRYFFPKIKHRIIYWSKLIWSYLTLFKSFGPKLRKILSKKNGNTKTVLVCLCLMARLWPSFTVWNSFRIIPVYPVSLFLNRIYDKYPW